MPVDSLYASLVHNVVVITQQGDRDRKNSLTVCMRRTFIDS